MAHHLHLLAGRVLRGASTASAGCPPIPLRPIPLRAVPAPTAWPRLRSRSVSHTLRGRACARLPGLPPRAPRAPRTAAAVPAARRPALLHTTAPPKAAPIVFRVGAMLGARVVSRVFQRLPEGVKRPLRRVFNGRTMRAALVVVGGLYMALLVEHLVVNPITGKRQLILLEEEDFLEIVQQEEAVLLEHVRDAVVPHSHRDHRLVARIVARLSNNPVTKGYDWRIVVVDDPLVNAMVLPTGVILVFRGILDLLGRDEDDVAVIIGHEMSHVVCRHAREALSQDIAFNLVDTVLWAVLAVAVGDVTLAVPFVIGSTVDTLVTYGVNLPHSRKAEYEADEMGLYLAAEACYDVSGAPLIWERMEAYGREENGETPEFMSTHPASATRRSKLEYLLPDVEVSSSTHNCDHTRHMLKGLFAGVQSMFRQ